MEPTQPPSPRRAHRRGDIGAQDRTQCIAGMFNELYFPSTKSNGLKGLFILQISVWTLFAVTTLLLISRFAIRLRVHGQLFWDDILAGLAYIFLLCHNILATLAAPTIYLLLDLFSDNHGFMQPDILGKVDRLVKLVLSSNFLFRICIYLVKASLLALLWRLFRSLPKFRRAWLGIIVVTVIGFALSMILPPVACSDFTAREFTCKTLIMSALTNL